MKIETSKLEGAALDWAVAMAVGVDVFISDGLPSISVFSEQHGDFFSEPYEPSNDWAQGGPLIALRSIGFSYIGGEWLATADETSMGCGSTESGPTHLIAAMRAIVAAELGDTVDTPEELAP